MSFYEYNQGCSGTGTHWNAVLVNIFRLEWRYGSLLPPIELTCFVCHVAAKPIAQCSLEYLLLNAFLAF